MVAQPLVGTHEPVLEHFSPVAHWLAAVQVAAQVPVCKQALPAPQSVAVLQRCSQLAGATHF